MYIFRSIVNFCLFTITAVNCIDSNDVPDRRLKAEFRVYWNSPTFQCRSHRVFFEEVAAKYGIVMNTGDTFRGDKISIMYDPGFFPALLKRTSSGGFFYRNGGLPQLGNLTEHLRLFTEHVEQQIPDPKFDGVGIIDFESWRPIFRQNFGSLTPYKEISRDLEHQTHPGWTNAEVEAEATRRFEKSGRLFMEETLRTVKDLRPLASWGYYAFPYCFNMNANKQETCGLDIQKENDRIMWLWNLSDNYYPSLYMAKSELDTAQKQQMIRGRVEEAFRLRKESTKSKPKEIIPYFWYRYRDDSFLSEEDMRNSIKTLKDSGVDGVIMWGSSNDVNNKDKCQSLKNYIEEVLGPILLST